MVAFMIHSPEMQAALDAAETAALIARSLYQRNVEIRIKADKSPVTEADVRCEMAIREIIEARFPAHGFYGEETGMHRQDAEFLWIVDPIDGTKAFVREYPMFSTQIALMHRGEIVLGVSSAPVYGEVAYAERGRGAFLNGKPIAVSNVSTNRIRGYGDFLHYHLLASGKIDAVIETDINILDIAACAAIVNEAGGRFTELNGAPITLESTTVLASNGRMHAPVLAALGSGS
jgi:histidinol-phosphatase